MNTYKENKMTMYLALLAWYNLHHTEADAIYKFKQVLLLIMTDVTIIGDLRALQEAIITGAAKEKKETRDLLEVAAMQVVVRVRSWATHEHNTELKSSVEFTMSDLRNAADTVLKDRATVILEIGQANIEAMDEELGLTEAMLTNLETLTAKYFGLIPMPRLKITERKTHREDMDLAFKRVDLNLAVLDDTIAIIRYDNPSLWDSYNSIRMIIDLKGKSKGKEIKTGMEGMILDGGDESALHNAKISSDKTDKVEHSDEEGYYKMALPTGANRITVVLENYTTFTEDVIIEEGVMLENDIDLEKPETEEDVPPVA